MLLSDFQYELPDELIAFHPTEKRSASRLLSLDRATGYIAHHYFYELQNLLRPNDLLVFNDTKVFPARLWGKKASGGAVEMLVERILDDQHILAHIRASKSPRPGTIIFFLDAKNQETFSFEMIKRHDDLFELKCESQYNAFEIIEKIGHIPLPPYIARNPEEKDLERYQTVFARHKGSVAAPTAGLHFDAQLIKSLQDNNISIGFLTLHVGTGTFAPVRVEDITTHKMHAERIQVAPSLCEQILKTKTLGGRVIAVGTTCARSLETASLSGVIKPFKGDTNIFIYPGFKFRCIDGLITNFHLSGSTLLMLVSAFAGYELTMHAYQSAICEKYRFFSYGDAMLIL